jgi:uncharacterized protein YhaN
MKQHAATPVRTPLYRLIERPVTVLSEAEKSFLYAKLHRRYLTKRCQQAQLAFKIHNLKKRLARIEHDEQTWTARRYYLGFQLSLLEQQPASSLPLTATEAQFYRSKQKQLEKHCLKLRLQMTNNEIRLLDLQKRKQRSNTAKLVLWESRLASIELSLEVLEAKLRELEAVCPTPEEVRYDLTNHAAVPTGTLAFQLSGSRGFSWTMSLKPRSNTGISEGAEAF